MIQTLEARRMLSIADTSIERFVHVDDGTLVIRADRTGRPNDVAVSREGSNLRVRLNTQFVSSRPPAPFSEVVNTLVVRDDVERIQIVAGDGKDTIEVSARVNRPARVAGASGVDVIVGAENDFPAPNGGIIRINGSDDVDTIHVFQIGGRVAIDHKSIVGGSALIKDYAGYNIEDIRAIEIYGNGGNDNIRVARFPGIPVLINGGDGNDTIQGSDGDETLQGGTGNDRITGMWGADLIQGGGGDDRLIGGDPPDTARLAVFIEGLSPDYDTIAGDSGRDTLRGGEEDIVSGGSGNDLVHLEGAPDEIVSIERSGPESSPVVLNPTNRPGGSFINLYRDDRGHLILQAAVRLSDSGWLVDWDFKQSNATLNVTATTYYSGGGRQAIWTYPKQYDLGPAFGENFVVRLTVNDHSVQRKNVTVNSRYPGERVELTSSTDLNAITD